MKKTYIITFLLLLALINANAQEQDPRWALTQPIEAEIEAYINENINSFQLSTEDLQSLTEDQHHENLSQTELENIILLTKKDRLRDLYFINNPNNVDLFLYEYIENNSKQTQQNCLNGDFVQRFQNYNFFSRVNWNHPGGNNVNFGANLNGFNPFIPSTILNNNSNASLVTVGFDPILQNFNINRPRVFNGNRAIKLNPRNGVGIPINNIPNQEDATILTRNFNIDENILSLNFAVSFFNPNHSAAQNPFVRFEVYDNILNTIVDSRVITSDNSGACLLDASPNWRYTNWSCLDLDVSQSIGNNATLRVYISDCVFTAHDAILYLDDICNNGNVCNNSLFGSLFLDPVNLNCPTDSFQVCGSFSNPACVNGNPNITLDIVDDNGLIIPVVSNAIVDNNNGTFCFTVNPNDFGANPSGNYEFLATATFGSDSQQITIQDDDANIGADVSFIDCPIPPDPCDIGELNVSVFGNNLVWNNIATSYDLEFYSDGTCCEENGTLLSANFTTTNTFFNVTQIITIINSKCFRFRIKTDCSNWSDWCCLAPVSNTQYSLTGDCVPSNPCDNYEDIIIITDNVLTSTTVEYLTYTDIEATNTIQTGATSNYRASNSIKLLPDFHSENNSNFRAYINDCISVTGNRNSNSTVPETKSKLNTKDLKIFPNPAQTEINIAINNSKIEQFELYNIQGQLIKSTKDINKNKQTINVQSLSRGFYILRVTLDDGSITNKNIILK